MFVFAVIRRAPHGYGLFMSLLDFAVDKCDRYATSHRRDFAASVIRSEGFVYFRYHLPDCKLHQVA